MYFNNKNNTNIDNEFNKNNNVLSYIKSFFSKYKKIVLISFIIIISIITLSILVSNKQDSNNLILKGNEIVTIYQGSDYVEPGYNAYNSRNEDLTNKVIIETNLNNNVIGKYEITYKIGGVTKVRYVNVIEKPNDYVFIHLTSVNNSVDIYLQKGENYKEPGYTAFSTSGKDLTNKVNISGKVDTSKKGIYKLTYSIIDSNNVTTSVSRKIIVLDSDITLTLNTDKYTNTDITINTYVIDEYFDYMILPDNNKVTTNKYSYKVSNNGTYTFKTYSKKGNVKESSIKVSNIDKITPNGSCSGNYKDGISTINVNASDNIGIDRYVINGKSYTSGNITINNELKTANITIYDKAGNSKDISCEIKKENKKLEIHFIASGAYDDAILIRTDNKTILIDGGQWYCRKYVTPYLKTLGITKIDAMIGSHLHFNHIQTQADILENFNVENIYYPDDIFTCATRKSCNTTDQQYILSEIKKKNITPKIAKPGNKVTIGEIELYFIGPENIITGDGYPQNYNSSIMILKFYNNTFMFTGDAGNSTLDINNLRKHANNLGINLNVDLLKYPHHGNATLKDNFLNTINTNYTIIPNYKAPHFPTTDNINKLKSHNIKMYRQSDSSTGNILVTSDGNNINIINNVKAEDYKR